jgi:Zn-dependent protease with chaperone function
VTRPTPTAYDQEEAQLASVRRHPYQTWSQERVSRVFLRLLPCLPQIHGHTYPFLGFSWWVTATGKVAVDHVWYPSPARDVGLKPGDVILAVNNWSLPTWVAEWDKHIQAGQEFFHDFLLVGRRSAKRKYKSKSAQPLVVDYLLPGELLGGILLDLKHIAMEARPRYLSGPVELLVQREGEKFPVTLYPQHLPAEYGILVNTQDRQINAYAAPGRIILTQRLVNFCLNDDELALVIGHELAHQAQGHLVRGAGHRQLALLAGEVLTAVSTFSLMQILNWKHFMVDPNVRQVAQDAVVSVFSQDDEREADIYGQWYAFQAGFNLEKGLAVLERMGAVDAKDPFLTTYFLDSHPAPLERLVRLRQTARYFQAGRAAEVFLQSADLDLKPLPD